MDSFKLLFSIIVGAVAPLGIAMAILYYTTGVANVPEIFQTDMMGLNLLVMAIGVSWPFMVGGAVAGLFVGLFWSARD